MNNFKTKSKLLNSINKNKFFIYKVKNKNINMERIEGNPQQK